MHLKRFIIIGGLAGVAISMTLGWLITGYLCHRFQRLTPATWRPERWRQHCLSVVWAAIGGAALGAVEASFGSGLESIKDSLKFALLMWAAFGAPVIATMATYVNLHYVVVAGLLLEWALFAVGVSLSCKHWAT